MGLTEVINAIPSYIRWRRSGGSDNPQEVSQQTLTQQAREGIQVFINNVYENGILMGWHYDLVEQSSELAEPNIWPTYMPSWIKAFPELSGKTFTEISTDNLGACNSEDIGMYPLILSFRDLTTELRIETCFYGKTEEEANLQRTVSGERTTLRYGGTDLQRLQLIREAWELAAEVKRQRDK